MKTRISNALTLSTLAVLACTAVSASAAIVGVTGSTTLLGSPPLDCTIGQLTGVDAFAWDEQTNVPLVGQPVDMVNNPGTSGAPVPGFVTGNYDSHFLHFEAIPGVIGAIGTVTFSQPIDAVIFRAINLDGTDISLGSPGTLYPTGFGFRTISTGNSSFSINANTLSFNFFPNIPVPALVQVRVLTAVPAPSAAAALGLAGLVALRRRR